MKLQIRQENIVLEKENRKHQLRNKLQIVRSPIFLNRSKKLSKLTIWSIFGIQAKLYVISKLNVMNQILFCIFIQFPFFTKGIYHPLTFFC